MTLSADRRRLMRLKNGKGKNMRLIDADVLKQHIDKLPALPDGNFAGNHSALKALINMQPTIEPEQRWIPCSERLPEEDVEVLITYRYKEGEGDTSHADIDITTYGQMYFGGNKVENHKHWRQPFEYFESNYEVVAWMPLPEPYRPEGSRDENKT